MGDKIRGAIAVLVGVFGLYQSFVLYQAHHRDWHLWVELAASLVLILIGTWRIRRNAAEPPAEQIK